MEVFGSIIAIAAIVWFIWDLFSDSELLSAMFGRLMLGIIAAIIAVTVGWLCN